MLDTNNGSAQGAAKHQIDHEGDSTSKCIEDDEGQNVGGQFDAAADHEVEVSVAT